MLNVEQRMARFPVLGDLAQAGRMRRAHSATGFVMESTPGHFGSPIPDLNAVRQREDEIFAVPASLPGIELNDEAQLGLVRDFAPLYRDQPFDRQRQEGCATGSTTPSSVTATPSRSRP